MIVNLLIGMFSFETSKVSCISAELPFQYGYDYVCICEENESHLGGDDGEFC